MRTRLLSAAMAAFLAACSGQPAVGPLGNGGSGGRQCVIGRQGQPVTIGIYALENKGNSAATVQSVRLPSARGLRMTRAWVTPIRGRDLIGAVLPYPPVALASSDPRSWGYIPQVWAERRPAAGAVVRPGQALNLVFGLTMITSHAGRSDGPVIVYAAGGATYTMQESVSLVVAKKCF